MKDPVLCLRLQAVVESRRRRRTEVQLSTMPSLLLFSMSAAFVLAS